MEAAAAKAQLTKLQGEAAQLHNDLAVAQAEVERRRAQPSTSDHEVLRRRLADVEEKLAIGVGEVEELRRQRNEYEEAIGGLDELNQGLQVQVDALTQAHGLVSGQVSELQSQLEQSQKQLEILSGPASSHARIRELEAGVFRAQAQVATLTAQVAAAEGERERLVEELKEREEELMGAEGKIAILRREVHRLMSLDNPGDAY